MIGETADHKLQFDIVTDIPGLCLGSPVGRPLASREKAEKGALGGLRLLGALPPGRRARVAQEVRRALGMRQARLRSTVAHRQDQSSPAYRAQRRKSPQCLTLREIQDRFGCASIDGIFCVLPKYDRR